jgi:hypothetical protein
MILHISGVDCSIPSRRNHNRRFRTYSCEMTEEKCPRRKIKCSEQNRECRTVCVAASGEVTFVTPRSSSCPNRSGFGDGYICVCPARKSSQADAGRADEV